jgi:hypothetical protein
MERVLCRSSVEEADGCAAGAAAEGGRQPAQVQLRRVRSGVRKSQAIIGSHWLISGDA